MAGAGYSLQAILLANFCSRVIALAIDFSQPAIPTYLMHSVMFIGYSRHYKLRAAAPKDVFNKAHS
ncbi:MAG: hypothetical protein ACI9WS_000079 [Paraglaciecola psychrophila]|jgi:hypothetical protein